MATLPLPDDPLAIRATANDPAAIASKPQRVCDEYRLCCRVKEELKSIDIKVLRLQNNPVKLQRAHDLPAAALEADRRFEAIRREPTMP